MRHYCRDFLALKRGEIEQVGGDFPSNEYWYFCLCSRYVRHQPGNSGFSLVAVAQEPTHFYEFVGCCQAVFFGVVLQ
jgi:hypothetical protein